MPVYRIGCLLLVLTILAGPGLTQAAPHDQLRALNLSLYPAPWPANDMTLKDLNGRPISLSSLHGKVVLLNFWKIDCPPCSMEKPILERTFRKYAGRGLEILAVNLVDEASRQQTYRSSHGYSFTFAFDPDNLLSLQNQSLGSGSTSTFLVNSRREAIYEISGVPTTYVIDRNGQVIGNAVGPVDWEQPVLAKFLESLLGPPSPTLAETRPQTINSPLVRAVSASASARPSVGFSLVTAGATEVYRSPVSGAEDPVSAPPQFHGPATASKPTIIAQTMPQAPEPVQEPDKSPSLIRVRPAKPPKATRTSKKREPAHVAVPRATERLTGPGGAPSAAKRPVAQPAPRAATPYGSRPVAVPASPTSPVATPSSSASDTRALPVLPPAMPYTPFQTAGSQPNPVPDSQGNVWARIPGASGPASGAVPSAQRPGERGLPSAQPLTRSNPISGFVLDSFPGSSSAPISQRPTVAPQEPAPASSFLGQLSQDFQNLGEGIRDVVSRIAPGR
jgi:thiol-disulfide isomerase/thioredoxin